MVEDKVEDKVEEYLQDKWRVMLKIFILYIRSIYNINILSQYKYNINIIYNIYIIYYIYIIFI